MWSECATLLVTIVCVYISIQFVDFSCVWIMGKLFVVILCNYDKWWCSELIYCLCFSLQKISMFCFLNIVISDEWSKINLTTKVLLVKITRLYYVLSCDLCRLFTSEVAPVCRILHKYTTFGESNTCMLTFLMSSSDRDSVIITPLQLHDNSGAFVWF